MALNKACEICGTKMRQSTTDGPMYCPDPTCVRSYYQMVILRND